MLVVVYGSGVGLAPADDPIVACTQIPEIYDHSVFVLSLPEVSAYPTWVDAPIRVEQYVFVIVKALFEQNTGLVGFALRIVSKAVLLAEVPVVEISIEVDLPSIQIIVILKGKMHPNVFGFQVLIALGVDIVDQEIPVDIRIVSIGPVLSRDISK